MKGSARSDSFSNKSSVHVTEVWTVNASEARNVAARTHRRVVFKENCQDVTSVEDFNDFLHAKTRLAQSVIQFLSVYSVVALKR